MDGRTLPVKDAGLRTPLDASKSRESSISGGKDSERKYTDKESRESSKRKREISTPSGATPLPKNNKVQANSVRSNGPLKYAEIVKGVTPFKAQEIPKIPDNQNTQTKLAGENEKGDVDRLSHLISKVIELDGKDENNLDKVGGKVAGGLLQEAARINIEDNRSKSFSNCKTPMKSKWDVPTLDGKVTPLIATIKYNIKHSSSKSNIKATADPDLCSNAIAKENKNDSNSSDNSKEKEIVNDNIKDFDTTAEQKKEQETDLNVNNIERQVEDFPASRTNVVESVSSKSNEDNAKSQFPVFPTVVNMNASIRKGECNLSGSEDIKPITSENEAPGAEVKKKPSSKLSKDAAAFQMSDIANTKYFSAYGQPSHNSKAYASYGDRRKSFVSTPEISIKTFKNRRVQPRERQQGLNTIPKQTQKDTITAANSGAEPHHVIDNDFGFELETDAHRLSQRKKQVDYGKNTDTYKRYREEVPKYKRGKSNPWTPDINRKMSKRRFDGIIRSWRRQLHAWNGSTDNSEQKRTAEDDTKIKGNDEEVNQHDNTKDKDKIVLTVEIRDQNEDCPNGHEIPQPSSCSTEEDAYDGSVYLKESENKDEINAAHKTAVKGESISATSKPHREINKNRSTFSSRKDLSWANMRDDSDEDNFTVDKMKGLNQTKGSVDRRASGGLYEEEDLDGFHLVEEMDIDDLNGSDDKPFMIIKRQDDDLLVCEDD